MIVFKKASEMGRFLIEKKQKEAKIGFVPTMGALHKGHISLIEESKKRDDLTVCSIFVNPTQFNDQKDFEKYPSTIESDIDMLEKAECDVLFLPELREIYPNGTNSANHFDLGYLETILEGRFRPGHFQGVCQVVYLLLTIVHCNRLYLGQKDYQQCMVLKKLITIRHFETDIIIVPTLRESDGLAMSSRNMRLNVQERQRAPRIYETLFFIKNEIKAGFLEDFKERAKQYLISEGFKVDYFEIANAETLEPVESWDGKTPLVLLVAAFLNEIRLIDNMLQKD